MKLPMFGCTDATQEYAELDEATKAYPTPTFASLASTIHAGAVHHVHRLQAPEL
jgi:hypothetical protein